MHTYKHLSTVGISSDSEMANHLKTSSEHSKSPYVSKNQLFFRSSGQISASIPGFTNLWNQYTEDG